MDETPLNRLRTAVETRRKAEAAEHAALLDVLRAGVRGWQARAVQITGASRETIRRKAREAGIKDPYASEDINEGSDSDQH
jgi:hypothetical protein